ncbi:hypothetical protein B0J12DRAFT_573339 [Macrophomina phaseolina]|uniref:Uncharacterized protein n=1 Tax=Macrophomina phaseolina TaxID=35725 RepID=A0ABQ8GAJ4_9PEZI|nr:hypothetical protein B0J12DRAFT_573339 [Macrophomina phaseolina]
MASPSHLHITLAQQSKSPPTVAVTVTNTHPSTPLTFVAWNTPLDPSALLLGTLVVTDARTGAQLNKDTIKVGRKTPPAADQFVTLAPGESKTQHFELEAPLVPLEGRDTVKVACRGAWGDVWPGERVGPESWAERSGKGVSGEFESEAVEVEL